MASVEKLRMNETKETTEVTRVVALDLDNNTVLNLETREGSEEAKKEAWYEVFPQYNKDELKTAVEKANKAIAGGIGDRRDVIKMVYGDFGIEVDEVEIDRCSDSFNEIVQKAVIKIGVPEENRRAIEVLSKTTSLYINTATPLLQSRETLQALGIIESFKGIYGRPGNKIQNLSEIITKEGIKPEELLFVGDQSSDWQAALAVGCRFIGMDTAGNTEWRQNKQPFPIIYSLKELVEDTNLVNYETK